MSTAEGIDGRLNKYFIDREKGWWWVKVWKKSMYATLVAHTQADVCNIVLRTDAKYKDFYDELRADRVDNTKPNDKSVALGSL